MAREKMDNESGITKQRLLLVVSDDLIRDIFTKLFEKSGYNTMAVEKAKNGTETLKDECFDVVICDYDLHDSTGVDFFESAKNVCPNKTNVLMITYGDLDNISETKNCRIHHIIEKPFPFEELLRIVKNSRLKN